VFSLQNEGLATMTTKAIIETMVDHQDSGSQCACRFGRFEYCAVDTTTQYHRSEPAHFIAEDGTRSRAQGKGSIQSKVKASGNASGQ
jgi:hypothetical protein